MLLKIRLLLICVLSMSYQVKLFLTHNFNSFLLSSILKKKSNSVKTLASDVASSIPELEFKQTTNFLYCVPAFQWSHLEHSIL